MILKLLITKKIGVFDLVMSKTKKKNVTRNRKKPCDIKKGKILLLKIL